MSTRRGEVVLKLGSTGYRMVSYYAGAVAYRLNSPLALVLLPAIHAYAVTSR